jgi:transposase
MRTIGSPAELQRRRHLAVQRLLEGYSVEEVADFLDAHPSSVRRWLAVFRSAGPGGLAARAVPGRPAKLTRTQEKIVGRWLAESPTEHGFPTQLWTCPRLAQLIEEEWGIHLNPRYLSDWLRARDFTPQRPRRVPRERDERAIADWLARDWPRIKKRPGRGGRPSPSSMRADC